MLVVLTPRTPNAKLVLASVRHSQRLSGGLLMPWIVAKTEGTIICGHCTCMAGLGEACSHIAALLFTLEKKHPASAKYCMYVFALCMVATFVSGCIVLRDSWY